MDSPNRITNRNSGSHEVIAPVAFAPIREAPQPYWNTATRMPYAAPTDSRLRTTALSGITMERKVTSSSRNASAITNPKTTALPEGVEGAERRRVVNVAGERDVDHGHGSGTVHVHRDRPGHLPGCRRPVREGGDSGLRLRRGHVLGLDDH